MAAIIKVQNDENQIVISSRLFLYGSEANQQIGELIIEEINRMYNEPNATLNLNGQLLKVLFDIHYEIISPAMLWKWP